MFLRVLSKNKFRVIDFEGEECVEIESANGQKCIFDFDDKWLMLLNTWQACKDHHHDRYYWITAYRHGSNGNEARTRVVMHRALMGLPKGMMVDHINGNASDNRRKNLRVVTNQQNQENMKKYKGKSKYKNVTWNSKYKKWYTSCRHNGRHVFFGAFTDELEAAKHADKMCYKLRGETHRLNFPELKESYRE